MQNAPSKEALTLANVLRKWAGDKVFFNAATPLGSEHRDASREAYATKLLAAADWLAAGGAESPEPPRATGKAPELGMGYGGEALRPKPGEDLYTYAFDGKRVAGAE